MVKRTYRNFQAFQWCLWSSNIALIVSMTRTTVELFIATDVCENAYSIESLLYVLAVKKCSPKEVLI